MNFTDTTQEGVLTLPGRDAFGRVISGWWRAVWGRDCGVKVCHFQGQKVPVGMRRSPEFIGNQLATSLTGHALPLPFILPGSGLAWITAGATGGCGRSSWTQTQGTVERCAGAAWSKASPTPGVPGTHSRACCRRKLPAGDKQAPQSLLAQTPQVRTLGASQSCSACNGRQERRPEVKRRRWEKQGT